MTWTSLRVTAPGRREAASAALFGAGAQGVHEDGTALVTHFPPEVDVAAVIRQVHLAIPDAVCETSPTEPIDWSIHWRDKLSAHTLGRLTIAPTWLAEGHDPATTIVIDPGMAFGTGDHPTTRGATRLLQDIMHPGLVVADLGAGSAVLSIAAAKLGASRVFAIEYDGDAIGNAEDNVRRNDVEGIVHVFEGDATILLPLVAPVDVVVANIISSVLVELLPAMHGALRPGGRAILSGILLEEREAMLDAIAADGWRLEREDVEDVWWSITIAKA
ncbi:MAG: 50S ribosomal protein L11 methyltransferase [Gemmatimonadetes bacterium]|nr:50S ribosomal protein L11 methyltransferase [Gemmatimonadota bacterium]MCC6773093.1 50S ribosomal protein L11 methyltransferase [Gemmatimonadaceae bacterium]